MTLLTYCRQQYLGVSEGERGEIEQVLTCGLNKLWGFNFFFSFSQKPAVLPVRTCILLALLLSPHLPGTKVATVS